MTEIIDSNGADPFVTRVESLGDSSENEYAYIKSDVQDTEIRLGFTKNLKDIGKIALSTIFSGREKIWAPELHRINDGNYVYFAANDEKTGLQSMFVIESEISDPRSKYGEERQVTPEGEWAIDGTVLEHNGNEFFITSGWPDDIPDMADDTRQDLFIRKMHSPTEMDTDRIRISAPVNYKWEYTEENGGRAINEGPAILKMSGRTFVAFSANASWTANYTIGLLELIGDDPMNPVAWKKHETPLLKSDEVRIGPGHCSFTKDEKDRTVILFHTSKTPTSGWDREVRLGYVVEDDGGELRIASDPDNKETFVPKPAVASF